MKIEIISGSPRTGSITKRMALHLKNWFDQNTHHKADIIDMKDWPLPPVQSVWVSEDKAPPEFQVLAKRIFNAGAFILVTPEYNGSYSPAMKNMLDHFPKQYHKSFGIVTASPGGLGGMRAAQQLLLLIPALFGIASPHMLITPSVDRKFSPDGDLLDESFQQAVHTFVTEFLWLAEKTVTEKVSLN
ncbi:MAG: NAD(P)H-dependent oxidoreductase [Sphingobacteriales bacterium]|nr:NAD(P)H-dependent oxidoreductase [Sphingobacteriales bacterium]